LRVPANTSTRVSPAIDCLLIWLHSCFLMMMVAMQAAVYLFIVQVFTIRQEHPFQGKMLVETVALVLWL